MGTAPKTQEPTKIVTHVSMTPKGSERETGQTRLTLHHNRQYRNNEAQTRRHPADTETRKSDFRGPLRGGGRTRLRFSVARKITRLSKRGGNTFWAQESLVS